MEQSGINAQNLPSVNEQPFEHPFTKPADSEQAIPQAPQLLRMTKTDGLTSFGLALSKNVILRFAERSGANAQNLPIGKRAAI